MTSTHEQPTRLDDRVAVEELLRRVRAGVSISVACKTARLGRTAFYSWLNTARDAKEPYSSFEAKCVAFVGELELAQAQAIERAELVISRAAGEDWRAAELSGKP